MNVTIKKNPNFKFKKKIPKPIIYNTQVNKFKLQLHKSLISQIKTSIPMFQSVINPNQPANPNSLSSKPSNRELQKKNPKINKMNLNPQIHKQLIA